MGEYDQQMMGIDKDVNPKERLGELGVHLGRRSSRLGASASSSFAGPVAALLFAWAFLGLVFRTTLVGTICNQRASPGEICVPHQGFICFFIWNLVEIDSANQRLALHATACKRVLLDTGA